MFPGMEIGWIETVHFSRDPETKQPNVLANELPSSLLKRKVREMVKRYRIPSEVHLLVPRREDIVLKPPLGYCAAY